MDKRIQELALQAGYKPVGTFADDLMEIYNKKFAELIVEECLNTMIQSDLTELEGANPEDVMYAVYDQTKKYFGVE